MHPRNRLILLVTLMTSVASSWAAEDASYAQVVRGVASIVQDAEAQRLAAAHGLNILNVLWEDTGRWQGSSVGPNISDVTLEVAYGEGDHRSTALMPVIRNPNFADKTADVRLDRFFVRVGNQSKGGAEEVISLQQLLADPLRYLSKPGVGTIKGGSLLAPRDSHALVSAQAALLPIPKGAKATFYPVIFNYQSYAKNPAVLTLLVTRQGVSMTVIDNSRDTVTGGSSWGQRLFFNAEGQRAPLSAERMSDVKLKGVTQNGEDASSLGEDANLLMLVQVPLKHLNRFREGAPMGSGGLQKAAPMPAPMAMARASRQDDMETAVLGHGALEGPYTELDGLTVERDPDYPVRVTVQFYQAISVPTVGDASMKRLAQQISRVYEKGDYVGSLVVPAPADRARPTNWTGVSERPSDTGWRDFPGLVERWWKYGNTGPVRQPVGIR